jgi:hypothetical protein
MYDKFVDLDFGPPIGIGRTESFVKLGAESIVYVSVERR